MRPRTIYSLLQAVLALIGAGIAGFLYREHEAGLNIPCYNGSPGCDIVNTSKYAYFLGHPVSEYGAVAYMALLFLAAVKLTTDVDKVYDRLAWFLLVTTTGGFFVSWVFQYIAKFVIDAFCIWCRASAITMTMLFILSLFDVATRIRASRRVGGASRPNYDH